MSIKDEHKSSVFVKPSMFHYDLDLLLLVSFPFMT